MTIHSVDSFYIKTTGKNIIGETMMLSFVIRAYCPVNRRQTLTLQPIAILMNSLGI
jgi:hypothetical protein